ncbi:MAG: hypothetical protein IAF94_15750 [Pirellulaceae bacterium]|nr:hypothetical protein [Pirellulaceae bacterium]
MKYSLRSLMIVVLVLPPLIAGAWLAIQNWNESRQPKNDYPEWYDQGDNVW